MIGRAVTVKIRRHGNIAELAPCLDEETKARFDDVPIVVRRPEKSDITYTVGVEISNYRFVAGLPEDRLMEGAICKPRVPGIVGRTEYHKIGLAISIPVGRNRKIAGLAPAKGLKSLRLRHKHVPRAGRRPENRYVGLGISIVIGGCHEVAGNSELLGRIARCRPQQVPNVVRRATDRKIGFAVSVAQYLPTVFAGNGLVATLTTEAVTLASGADRRVVGAYATLQALLPMAGFAVAVAWGRGTR